LSKLELDDQILNHPKFIRAVKLGGSDTVHMWLGIRAYCGQNLTDGFVPSDMLDEVRGPAGSKKRDAALKVLRDVGLLEPADGGIQMHDFLQWSRSKSQVLADRERARVRQAKSRGESQELSRRDIPEASGVVTKASASASASPTPSAVVAAPARDEFGRFPMFVGWQPSEPGWKAAEMTVGGERHVWVLPVFVAQFSGHFAVSPGDVDDDAGWNQRWQKWVSRGWGDSSRRPKHPDANGADDGYGDLPV